MRNLVRGGGLQQLTPESTSTLHPRRSLQSIRFVSDVRAAMNMMPKVTRKHIGSGYKVVRFLAGSGGLLAGCPDVDWVFSYPLFLT